MARFLPYDSIIFKAHPVFERVKIAKLAGKSQNAPIGTCILELEPGTEIPVHTHEESVDSIYVLWGQAEIFTDGKWTEAGPGDYCLVYPSEEHGVRNTGTGSLRLFIVHSPPLF